MQSATYIAHIRKKDGKVQLLKDHLLEVSEIAGETAAKIGLKELGIISGLLHDIGKWAKEFQDYLQLSADDPEIDQDNDEESPSDIKRGKIDHSTAGAQFLFRLLEIDNHKDNKDLLFLAQIVSLVIVSHHGGLIDCISVEKGKIGFDVFRKRIEKDISKTHYNEVIAHIDPEIIDKIHTILNSGTMAQSFKKIVKKIDERPDASNMVKNFFYGLLARFLLSCLIEGDHRNTSEFEYDEFIIKKNPIKWEHLIAKLERKYTVFSQCTEEIAVIRQGIASNCLAAAKRPQGIFTLTVPTGGGKTLASLRFAMHHAQKHNLERIFYILPYTTIIDQNAGETRNILEMDEENGSIVLEHHSNLLPEKITWKYKKLKENWDVPVIYTTTVQFFEALFGKGTRNARRMHALANSVIIFDEVQTIPVRCAHMFSNAINFLTEITGSTIVLCTATQPLFHEIDSRQGAALLSENSEIVHDVTSLYEKLQRVTIEDLCRQSMSENDACNFILEKQHQFGNVLVIVNTKKTAKLIYDGCKQNPDITLFHLSTNMCPKHRKEKIDKMKELLKAGKPLICISTSLIEAGIDISFRSVIRSRAGLDSIAQAAGRCNRNKEFEKGYVYVVSLDFENTTNLTDIEAGKGKYTRVQNEFQNNPGFFKNYILSPEAISRYFFYYFTERRDIMNYPLKDASLLSLLSNNTQAIKEHRRLHNTEPLFPMHQAFKTAANEFNFIEKETIPVIVPFDEAGKEIINAFYEKNNKKVTNKILQEAQLYSINVYQNDLDLLIKNNAVHLSPYGTYTANEGFYHPEYGISFEQCVNTNFIL